MATKNSIQTIVELYVYSRISNESAADYGRPECETMAESMLFVAQVFNIEHQGVDANEWLQGLPTVLDLEFYNHAILALVKSWGLIKFDPFADNLSMKRENMCIDAIDKYWARCGAVIAKWHGDWKENGNCERSARLLKSKINS